MSAKVTYRVGEFTCREKVRWVGSVLETRDGESYRVHVPWLSADAEALAEALRTGDRETVSRLRHSSYRMSY